MFDKLSQDIWAIDKRAISVRFTPIVNLRESMRRYENFIIDNQWYTQEKFGFAL